MGLKGLNYKRSGRIIKKQTDLEFIKSSING